MRICLRTLLELSRFWYWKQITLSATHFVFNFLIFNTKFVISDVASKSASSWPYVCWGWFFQFIFTATTACLIKQQPSDIVISLDWDNVCLSNQMDTVSASEQRAVFGRKLSSWSVAARFLYPYYSACLCVRPLCCSTRQSECSICLILGLSATESVTHTNRQTYILNRFLLCKIKVFYYY